ncbi:hypothetical protein IE81DRAFT_5346 [Ceraceosorus guamensis]|uniref:Uncharacterized protein n=1 Tax=Ceraceosorus guamensis TaxID=1522189 RepID=A0A316WA21_9BASI|nr:hypothetical protein IE81DRAFT_5346 [Ceraceosorus guamensis]PWN46354.1 hypothetical protein IE81DRAFT_5346 [Ceraceosorus guamensis]
MQESMERVARSDATWTSQQAKKVSRLRLRNGGLLSSACRRGRCLLRASRSGGNVEDIVVFIELGRRDFDLHIYFHVLPIIIIILAKGLMASLAWRSSASMMQDPRNVRRRGKVSSKVGLRAHLLASASSSMEDGFSIDTVRVE